jgi:hypothetical protein
MANPGIVADFETPKPKNRDRGTDPDIVSHFYTRPTQQ